MGSSVCDGTLLIPLRCERVCVRSSFAMCCCRCCLWCLEKCLKFINKNAYIETALYGLDFCNAACKAFGTILRNLMAFGAIAFVYVQPVAVDNLSEMVFNEYTLVLCFSLYDVHVLESPHSFAMLYYTCVR